MAVHIHQKAGHWLSINVNVNIHRIKEEIALSHDTIIRMVVVVPTRQSSVGVNMWKG